MAEPSPMETSQSTPDSDNLPDNDDEDEDSDSEFASGARRWWANESQKAFLFSRQSDFYAAQAAGRGAVTKFNKKLEIDFLKRYPPLKLCQQFNSEKPLNGRLPVLWNEACPSLHGNAKPSSSVRRSPTALDAIRRVGSYFSVNPYLTSFV